jgi:hypothetical protein
MSSTQEHKIINKAFCRFGQVYTLSQAACQVWQMPQPCAIYCESNEKTRPLGKISLNENCLGSQPDTNLLSAFQPRKKMCDWQMHQGEASCFITQKRTKQQAHSFKA